MRGQLCRVAISEQQPGLAFVDQLRNATHTRGHRGAAARHRLQQRVWKRLRHRRQHEDINPPEPIRHVRAGGFENAIRRHSTLLNLLLQHRQQRPAPHNQQLHAGAAHVAKRFNQKRDILLRPQRADDADHQILSLRFGGSRMENRRVVPVVIYEDFTLRNGLVLNQMPGRGFGVHHDAVRHPVRDAQQPPLGRVHQIARPQHAGNHGGHPPQPSHRPP